MSSSRQKGKHRWHIANVMRGGELVRPLGAQRGLFSGEHIELWRQTPDGVMRDRQRAVCVHCAADMTPARVRSWLKCNARRRFAPPLTCGQDCYSAWSRAPAKADREEEWARGEGDGRFRTGHGGKI